MNKFYKVSVERGGMIVLKKRISNLNLKIYLSMSLQKNEWGKFCNCRNSKCMKLYCECFAARVECGKNCHCIDCHNKNNAQHLKLYKDFNTQERKSYKEELAREHKGCACRKSGCTKKYCECYQAGLLCREICKCIECQNNQSLSNKKVISELKRNTSSTSNKVASLYPIILTQDNRHLKQILADQNPLNIKDEWIEKTAEELYKKAGQGSFPGVIESLIDILWFLQNDSSYLQNEPQYFQSDSNYFKEEIQQKQERVQFEAMEEEDSKQIQNSNLQDSSSMMQQEEPQSYISESVEKEEKN